MNDGGAVMSEENSEDECKSVQSEDGLHCYCWDCGHDCCYCGAKSDQ